MGRALVWKIDVKPLEVSDIIIRCRTDAGDVHSEVYISFDQSTFSASIKAILNIPFIKDVMIASIVGTSDTTLVSLVELLALSTTMVMAISAGTSLCSVKYSRIARSFLVPEFHGLIASETVGSWK